MSRRLIAAIVTGVIGLGVATQAQAGDWRDQRRHDSRHHDTRDRNHDGRHDWRDHRVHDHGRRHAWDRNGDGRHDWRDHRHYGHDHGRHEGWRDRNRDGRVDWRDQGRHSSVDRNRDGRIDWRDRLSASRPQTRRPVLAEAGTGRCRD
ncbi:MAG: hypothetical protein IPK81_10015 [Rhodospirillales bacterium]|nr:MAG: hypothetical protein IPK81_10015 [Rhodospirillales bacterium]